MVSGFKSLLARTIMLRPCFLAVALLCASIFPCPLASAELRFRVEIDPGEVPRRNSPASVRLAAGEAFSRSEAAALPRKPRSRLAAAGGAEAPLLSQAEAVRNAQGELEALIVHWIEKRLDPGEKRVYELVLDGCAEAGRSEESFRFADGDGWRDLLLGDTSLYRHVTAYDPADHQGTYKPFHHLYGFQADGFITKGPGGLYTHHRGLFIGWNKTRPLAGDAASRGWDFWHCTQGAAIRHRGYLEERETIGPVLGRAASVAEWTAPDGKAVVRERCEVTAWRQVEAQALLDFTFTLEAVAADLRLDGDPQHAGFQFRAVEAVEGKGNDTTYVRPASASGGQGDVWEECAWVAGLFSVKGRRYAVMHMDAPANPRPAVYSTRAYGRFGAYFSAELKEGKPLALSYRLLVLDAEKHPDVSAERFAKKYEDFARPLAGRAARQ
jgi:hypothetical protein